jgi:hypothetical protein
VAFHRSSERAHEILLKLLGHCSAITVLLEGNALSPIASQEALFIVLVLPGYLSAEQIGAFLKRGFDSAELSLLGALRLEIFKVTVVVLLG